MMNALESVELMILAQDLLSVESINNLIARPSYENKIQILDHQTKTALQVMNNFAHRALLADEVGLGKTIEAGIIMKEFIMRKMTDKILILTPANLKFQWQQELKEKFNEDFTIADNPDDYEGSRIIASIDTAKTPKHKNAVTVQAWDLIIVDEAHKLKNNQTLNYKLVKALHSDRILMLTATPLQNNLFELWALLDLLHPGYMGTRHSFKEKYVADKQGLKIKNKEELNLKLSKIMIRNLRKDAGIRFAERNVKSHYIKFSDNEMDFYSKIVGFIKKRYVKISKTDKEMTKDELKDMAKSQKGLLTFKLIMLTRQITSSLRAGTNALKRFEETIEDEKEKREFSTIIDAPVSEDSKMAYLMDLVKKTKDKTIIFTSFIDTQKAIAAELAIAGIDSALFNGQMNPEDKQAALQDFKMNKQIMVCTDAGSEGINLQFANTIVNYDLPWNPMRIEQRIGRVHRIGQEKDVQIHNIAVLDTIEAYILNRLYEKIDLFHVAIGDMDLILSQLKTRSFETDAFDSFMQDSSELAADLEEAKENAVKIKNFDEEVFDA